MHWKVSVRDIFLLLRRYHLINSILLVSTIQKLLKISVKLNTCMPEVRDQLLAKSAKIRSVERLTF